MVTWYPDICPTGQCMIELEKTVSTLNWSSPKSFRSICTHHKNLGLTDQDTFDAIVQSSRVKERVRWVVKVELGLDKEHPGVPYRVDADGGFTIGMDKTGTKMTEWPTKKADKDALIAAVNSAVEKVEKPSGTSAVRIA